MHGSTHLEGIGNVDACLPMKLKALPMEIYYDTDYPFLIFIETPKATHFISIANIQSGTFKLGKPAKGD